MLVINSIEKTRLSADSFSYSGSGVAWKARLVLFLGFALMAGGLAGSVVSGPGVPYLPIEILTKWWPGGAGAQIRRSRVSVPDAVLRDCECSCEWVDYAKVCTAVCKCVDIS